MKPLPPIAETISQGGRNGSVETADEGFRIEFKPPSEKQPEGLTPEHLFGAAWAACFNGAVKYIAKESGHADEGITVTARVQLHPEGPQPFSVELQISIPGIDEHKAERVVAKAQEICAYSKATKGNVPVKLTLD